MAATDPPLSTTSLVDQLAEELARRWHAGERPVVEDYLALYPQLAQHPEAAAELIYEELCLRQELEHQRGAADVLRRFPQWAEQVQVLIQFHDFLEPIAPAVSFPAPGESVGDFRLLAELGRGAHGRVFIATQAALADRAVVLKFVPRSGQEHLALARLQHTHIVPLYSLEDDPARGWRALCMPYFGGATLAQLLERMQGQAPDRRTGKDLLRTLADAQAAAPLRIPVEGPACQFLDQVSYARAICWLGVCLAEALQYTHERGLVHLDIKPANVLWAADGQPMLLDLHLAKAPIAAGAAAPAWLGGTPAYMAPEQRRAMAAVDAGRNMPVAVDGRADLYALGLVLIESLAGCLPPPGEDASSWLPRRNPQVSAGLVAILGRCVAEDPHDRYSTAAVLSEELRRHLTDRPVRGTALTNTSTRWRPWRRYSYQKTLVGLALAALSAAGLALAYVDYQGRPEEPHGKIRLAERAAAIQDLHGVVEHLRMINSSDGPPDATAQALAEQCRALWQQRDLIARRLDTPVPSEHDQVHSDLLDLAILWTDLGVRLAAKDEVRARRQEALDVLTEAEQLFGPSCVLDCERQAHAAALGLPRVETTAPLPRTAWEHFAVGRAHFQAGNLDEAAAQFDQALAFEPQGFWAYFYKGQCTFQQSRFEDAILAFTACIVLAPDKAWCYYNRGSAYEALGQAERAMGDYDRSLQLDPTLAPAALNRARILPPLRRGGGGG